MEKMKKMVIVMMVMFMLFVGSLVAYAGQKVVYTVKWGDTYSELMFRWGRQGIEIEKMDIWNPSVGNRVKAGQEIIYYLPDRPSIQKLSDEQIKKIINKAVDNAVAKTIEAKKSQDKKQEDRDFKMACVVSIALLIVIVILILVSKKQPKGKKEHKEAAADEQQERQIATIKLEANGLLKTDHETDIEFDPVNNRWLTPFCHLEGKQERMYAETRGEARRSAQKCWKNTIKYGDQIKKLIAEKKIREIKQQTKA